VSEQRYRDYQQDISQQEKEQKREQYLRQLEEERKQKEQEKADIIKELVNYNIRKVYINIYRFVI
jgi:CDK-activating kinase assembly factor MAT1